MYKFVPRGSKYKVTMEEWKSAYWPDFVVGFCYVMTRTALSAIMEAYNR